MADLTPRLRVRWCTDTAQYVAELDRVMLAMQTALADLTRSPDRDLALERGRVGGNLSDALLDPDGWSSASCAAWLHDTCPPEAADLGCACGCHEGSP